jgi:hypothetical protein
VTLDGLNAIDRMRVIAAERAAAQSPDGQAWECRRCAVILPKPGRHYAIMQIECVGGGGEFEPFKQPVPDATPRPTVPVFMPAPRAPRTRRAR